MTQAEILKMMADAVVTHENCVLEVTIADGMAMAHLIPADIWIAEGEDEDDEEE